MKETQWRQVSIGYVAENKSRQTHEIAVSLTELTPFVNGELTGGVVTDEFKTTNAKGVHVGGVVHMSNVVIAKWKGEGTNRVSSPDVRRGDRVTLWRYENTDIYYWEPLDVVGKSIKKRETVTYAFSNTTDEKENTLTESNAYVQEISTHDKLVTLIKTSKSDGEKFGYTVQVNTKDNVIVIADDAGNFIQLNSNDRQITLKNSDNSFIDINGKTITIEAEEIKINGHKSISYTSQSQTYNVKETTWNGNATWTGDINQTGNYTLKGDMSTNGSLTNNGKNVGSNHAHANSGGRGTGGPPI